MHIRFPAALCCLTALSLTAQAPESTADGTTIRLVHAEFDPLAGVPPVPIELRGGEDVDLWIVQFAARPTERMREAVRAAGTDVEVHGYLPEHAHVVRMDHGSAARVARLADVRWVGFYEPAYRLEPFLRAELAESSDLPRRRYHLVVVDKHRDKPGLATAIRALGGGVEHEQPGSLLFDVRLSGPQLVQAARLDQVLWVDRWTPPEEDMNNARMQGGANYVEAQAGYTGSGVRGHVYEGVEATHPDFSTPFTNVQSCGSSASHGQSTAGIVFGNGNSHPNARGMAPDAIPFYTNYQCVNSGVSRWQVVQELVDVHRVMFTTASWGDSRTTSYTSVSADADDIVFDHGIAWTNSQSNAGDQDSRPQAWAKNVFSIGGVRHNDNVDRNDDSWAAGNASTGPAADGRIKPELCAYYDNIWTVNTQSFGGTSGATPIVAGHNAIAIQMFTDGIFGNPPRVPGGTRFENRPRFTTLKALQVANARQYPFSSSSTDNRREHCGFGFPDLKQMYDNRARMLIVDETDVLTQGASTQHVVTVLGSEPELKVAMSYADPAGNPVAALTRVNDLDLRVVSPSGTIYHGNHGLWDGNYSTPGGAPNDRDTVECVFVAEPEAGAWTVEVSARLIAQDGHVETAAIDADYGLCMSFGTRVGSITAFGSGCVGSGVTPSYCASANPDGGVLANDSRTHEYAYDVSAPAPTLVTDVEFFTQSRTGVPETTTAAIYAAGPATGPLATTSITVGTAAAFYRATFNPPVSVPAGTFHVALSHAGATTTLCNLTGGAAVGGYWRSTPLIGTWSRSGIIDHASVRVFCQGYGGLPSEPTLVLDGVAEIGEQLRCRVERAAASTTAALVTGESATTYLGVPLPLSLDPLGAAGCSLLVSNDGVLPLVTDTNGRVAPFVIDVPSDSALVGEHLFQQLLVLDPPANVLGVVTSSAYRIIVGG